MALGSAGMFRTRSAMVCLALVSLVLLASPVRGYGEEYNGYPDHREREMHFFSNAARCAPTTYRSKTGYGADSDTSLASVMSLPVVAPLRYSRNLNIGSRAHSVDMASSCGLTHSSCDGTSWDTRIYNEYGCGTSVAISENVLYNYYTNGLADINQWLCDSTGTSCASDGSSSAGHRTNIMSSSNVYLGAGGAKKGTTYYYATQDFAGSTCAAQPEYGLTVPIYDGVSVTASSKTRFLTTFYSSVAPTTAQVVINGTAYSLSVDMGNTSYGVYAYSQTSASVCRKFYFNFVVSGKNYTYPTNGSLVTYGEGTCTTNYSSDRITPGGSAAAPSCTLSSLPSGASAYGNCSSTVTSGVSCTVTCSSGYSAVAGTCSSGTWVTSPTCTAKTCSLTNSGTGVAGWGTCASTVASGANCSFICLSGYTAVNGACSLGSWTTSPSCTASATCSLSLGTGAASWGNCSSTVSSGTICAFSCSIGYSATSGYCYSGSWSATPTCTANPCTLTKSSSASGWGNCSSSVASGSNCAFTCSAGSTATTGYCTAGSWTTSPTCSESPCTLSGLATGASAWGSCSSSVSSGSSCNYTCSSGYTAISGACSKGTWTATPSCSANNCPLDLPSTASSWGTCTSSVASGSSCSFECSSGANATTGICRAGLWTTQPTCVSAGQCVLAIPEGGDGWGTCSSSVSSEVTCSVSCKTGYSATSGTCSSGTWTTVPSCSANECSLSGEPSGSSGWGNCTTSVSSGLSCYFTCKPGYNIIVGSCSAGTWTTSPSCIAQDTNSDASPGGSTKSGSGGLSTKNKIIIGCCAGGGGALLIAGAALVTAKVSKKKRNTGEISASNGIPLA